MLSIIAMIDLMKDSLATIAPIPKNAPESDTNGNSNILMAKIPKTIPSKKL